MQQRLPGVFFGETTPQIFDDKESSKGNFIFKHLLLFCGKIQLKSTPGEFGVLVLKSRDTVSLNQIGALSMMKYCRLCNFCKMGGDKEIEGQRGVVERNAFRGGGRGAASNKWPAQQSVKHLLWECMLKGLYHEIFEVGLFHQTTPPGPMRGSLEPFLILI